MHPKDADGMANSVDPDQTASLEAVWSWSALLAETYLSQYIEFVRYFELRVIDYKLCLYKVLITVHVFNVWLFGAFNISVMTEWRLFDCIVQLLQTIFLLIKCPGSGIVHKPNNSNILFSAQFPPGRVAQSVGHLTRKSEVPGSIPGLATYFRFSFRFFKTGSCQLLAKVCALSTG